MSEHSTHRLLMFEVYEADGDFPLMVTSDSTEARTAMTLAGDRLVKRHWLREGCVNCDPGQACCAAHGTHVDPHRKCVLR